MIIDPAKKAANVPILRQAEVMSLLFVMPFSSAGDKNVVENIMKH